MAFFAVAGCTRVGALGSELIKTGSISASSFTTHLGAATSERSSLSGDSVQLTSAALPRMAFASIESAVNDLDEADRPIPMNGLCPANMASVDDRFCVDKYEASLVEVLPDGEERPFPFYVPVDGHKGRAVSEKGVYPQGYISGREAARSIGCAVACWIADPCFRLSLETSAVKSLSSL